MKQYEEIEIIEGCKRNERNFQEILYKRYFSKMMSMCMHHANGDKNLAMEMLNVGMLRVFQNISKYESRGSFEGWVRRIIYHKIIDFHKENNKYNHFLIFEEKDIAEVPSGLQNCYVEDIHRLVEMLPPVTQRVFKLYAIEGYSHKEIGELLNMSDGTSKWHLHTAREKLKQLLDSQYFKKINKVI